MKNSKKETQMSDLKPCPFCGTSNEKHNNIVKLYDDEYYAYEYCNACGARVYANWNTRPIEDALQARIDELERRIANALDSATAAQNCIKIARVDIYKVLERIKYILTAPQKEG
jgi:hypothetical protein